MRRSALWAWLYAASAASLAWLSSATWHRQIDDQFISITYANELATNGALQYSTGERVEGYSNFIYTVCLAAAIRADLDPVIAGKTICLLSGIAVLWMFASRVPRNSLGVLVVTAVAAWEPMAYWSSVGLETTQYAAILAGGWMAAAAPGREAWGALLLSVAALSRPEGIAHVAAAAILMFLQRPKMAVLKSFAVPAVGLSLYFVARYLWFGTLIPTPYLAKVSSVPFTWYGLRQAAAEISTGLGIVVSVSVAARTSRRDLPWIVAPLAIQLAVLWRLSGDWMSEARFVLPGLLASSLLWTQLGTHKSPSAWRVGVAILGIASASFWSPRGYGAWVLDLRTPPHPSVLAGDWVFEIDTPLQEDLSWVVEHVPPGDSIFVVDAGILGLVPDVALIDARGLNTRSIALAAAKGEADSKAMELVSSEDGRPDFFRVANWEDDDTQPPEWLRNNYTEESSIRYSRGRIHWFHDALQSPPPALVHDRWQLLHRQLPSLAHIAWRALVAAVEAADTQSAERLASEGSRRWPADRRFADSPKSASFPGGPMELEWVPGRGAALYRNGTLESRRLSARSRGPARLQVDVDAPGAEGVSLRIEARNSCGASTSTVRVTRRDEVLVPLPNCDSGADTRVSVTFENDTNAETGDRNAYIQLVTDN